MRMFQWRVFYTEGMMNLRKISIDLCPTTNSTVAMRRMNEHPYVLSTKIQELCPWVHTSSVRSEGSTSSDQIIEQLSRNLHRTLESSAMCNKNNIVDNIDFAYNNFQWISLGTIGEFCPVEVHSRNFLAVFLLALARMRVRARYFLPERVLTLRNLRLEGDQMFLFNDRKLRRSSTNRIPHQCQLPRSSMRLTLRKVPSRLR